MLNTSAVGLAAAPSAARFLRRGFPPGIPKARGAEPTAPGEPVRGASVADSAEWWRDYFDHDFIHLYRPFLTPERTQEEVAALRDLLGLPLGARVLDLACGWGRHAIELARSGYRVTGLDLSETLLERARRRAAATGVEVEWVQGDMRELPWHAEFDAVLSLFSSLGYFLDDAEDVRVLTAAAGALKPDGVFLLETMHRDQVARSFAERDWWPGEDGTPVWVERDFDAVTGISREWLRWRRPDGNEAEKFHALRVRNATEWGALLRRGGLEPVEWYGEWNLSPFDHESERLVVVCRRHP